jgi:eukaryotic-like serine/threonine-protein kinase
VTKQGIKLLDFGLAKQNAPVSDADATRALTREGQIVGTLQYMSPEQLHGKDADPRSDLFSFGCVLYEMLTGKRAFEGQSAASVIAAILEREPAPLQEAPPLERVVRRSLAKDPDQRFQTARDLKAALTWALEQSAPLKASKPDHRWWFAVAVAVALGAASSWAVMRFRHPPADERVLRFQIDPPQGGRFVLNRVAAGGLAISPDGKTTAYVADANGKTGLWILRLDDPMARLVSGTEGAAIPFWSPDNKSVAFVAGGKLQRVDLAGGSPSTICDSAPSLGGSWGSDGYILLGTHASGLFRVSASGGTPSPLTTLDASRGETSHRWPQVLPGGRFLYLVMASKPENSGVYAASLAKPSERVKLVTTNSSGVYATGADGKGYLLWLRGRALVAQEFDLDTLRFAGEPHPIAESLSLSSIGQMNVASSANGRLLYGAFGASTQFTWFDRTGKPLAVVGEPSEQNFMFRLSPDAQRIVVQRNTGGVADLWLVDSGRGLSSRFTAGTARITQPIWSPDGRTILFTALGWGRLFRKAANGVGDEELVTQRPGAAVARPVGGP